MLKLGSACSGIGCIDLGLERAGFEPQWQIEINGQCRSVLERHWPDVERYEDLAKHGSDLPPVDLICAGTPCQDLSMAGRREGLDGKRSGLFVDFIRLADRQPWAWLLWENVAGALWTNKGRDFAVCLEGFTGVRCRVPAKGWRNAGVAVGPLRSAIWWLADAQYFGVAQRRRRVYVVAGPRGLCRPEVLLEPDGVRRDLAAGGEAWAGAPGSPGSVAGNGRGGGRVVSTLTSAATGGYRLDDNDAAGGHVVCEPMASALTASSGRTVDAAGAMGPRNLVVAPLTGRGHRSHDQPGAESQIVFDESQITSAENRSNPKPGDPVPALAATSRLTALGQRPRRLTPLECERLQGLDDDWTRYRPDGKEIADSPRYRMIGNGAAVPHVEWIGRRIVAAMEA